jgi:hypothetical protein
MPAASAPANWSPDSISNLRIPFHEGATEGTDFTNVESVLIRGVFSLVLLPGFI